jgi:hypothetical protein
MSKPLKLLFKTFNKASTQTTASTGSTARDYSHLFFSEKCDIFVMQNGRQQPGPGSSGGVVGTITRKFDNTLFGTTTGIGAVALWSWFPPYFYDAVRTETTTTFPDFLIDKFSMSPSIPFLIEDTVWIPVTTEAGGTPSGVFTGVHAITFNNGSGQRIVIGSYVQNGAVNAQETTNFGEMINKMLLYVGNNPFIMCCNLQMVTSNVNLAFYNSNAAGTCDLNNGVNAFVSQIFNVGNVQNLEPNIFFVSRGLSLTIETPPSPGFTTLPNWNEYPDTIITLNNFIIQNPNTTNYNNTISKWQVTGGSLANDLAL